MHSSGMQWWWCGCEIKWKLLVWFGATNGYTVGAQRRRQLHEQLRPWKQCQIWDLRRRKGGRRKKEPSFWPIVAYHQETSSQTKWLELIVKDYDRQSIIVVHGVSRREKAKFHWQCQWLLWKIGWGRETLKSKSGQNREGSWRRIEIKDLIAECCQSTRRQSTELGRW